MIAPIDCVSRSAKRASSPTQTSLQTFFGSSILSKRRDSDFFLKDFSFSHVLKNSLINSNN